MSERLDLTAPEDAAPPAERPDPGPPPASPEADSTAPGDAAPPAERRDPIPGSAEAPAELGGPAAAVFGWLAFALVDTVITFRVPGDKPSLASRITEHGFEIGWALAVGLISAAGVWGWTRLRQRLLPRAKPWLRVTTDFLALTLVTITVGFVVVVYDLSWFAARKGFDWHINARLLRSATISALSLSISFGMLSGRLFGRPWLRWVAILVGMGVAVVNYGYLLNDYWNVHVMFAWLAAATVAGALSTIRLPSSIATRAPLRRALWAVAAVWALAALVVRPSPAVVAHILLTRGTPYTPIFQLWGYEGKERPAKIPPAQAAWFASRAGLPPIPSTANVQGARKTIVIMLTVDSMRSEILNSKKYDAYIPTLAPLRQSAVYFPNAYSPGSQTVYTMTSWFTGKYFSQVYWAKTELDYWPSKDTTVRFPATLNKAGVPTIYYMAGKWLNTKNGLVGGFETEDNIRKEGRYNNYATAREVAERIAEELQDYRGGPLYIFAHFMDSHAPYDRGGKTGTPFERYLREVKVVDAQIGRIRREVKALGLQDRTTIIISADHGESFGEHGTHQHAVSVYDELIHVPLLIEGPGYVPREVPDLVSTMDFGPTILDLFGLDTPGHMMGESLVEVLRGKEPRFTRPVVSENRLRQAMMFPDGVKVIRDLRFGAADAYDLKTDPLELHNRIDDPTLDTSEHFALLKAFFDAHTLTSPPGYRPPFRR